MEFSAAATQSQFTTFLIFQPEEFWGGIARSQLNWFKDFDSVMECDMRQAKFEWFKGGKLNAAGKMEDQIYIKNIF